MRSTITSALLTWILTACSAARHDEAPPQPPAPASTTPASEDEPQEAVGARFIIVEALPAQAFVEPAADPAKTALLAQIPECRSTRCRVIAAPVFLAPPRTPARIDMGATNGDEQVAVEVKAYPLDEAVFLDARVQLHPPAGERAHTHRLDFTAGLVTGELTRLGALTRPAGGRVLTVYAAVQSGSTAEVTSWLRTSAQP